MYITRLVQLGTGALERVSDGLAARAHFGVYRVTCPETKVVEDT